MPSFADVYSRHQHFLERYKTSQVNMMRPFIRRIERRLREELSKTQTIRSRSRLKTKLRSVEQIVFILLNDFNKQFADQMDLFTVSEAEFANKTIARFDNSFDEAIPALSRLRTAATSRPFNNRFLRDELNDLAKGQAKLIRDSVSMSWFEGATTPEMIREIVGTKAANYQDGLLNVTRNKAERMIRTATTHIAATAKEQLYKENSDIIKHYEWISTLDARTSSICQGLSGEIFEVGKGKLPPAHPNCRSTTAPIFIDDVQKVGKGFKKLNDNDQFPTYNEWLGKQSKAFQIEALGPTKAELFRKGGLSVDKFTDRKDAPLTLDQLKAKNPTAWKKAKIDSES